MDYVQFGRREEQQRRAELLRELPREIQRDAPEVGVPQEVVQVVREQLEHQTQVVPPHEVSFQFHWKREESGASARSGPRLTYVILVLRVGPVHHLEELDLDLGLVEEGLLVLDDLDGDVALLFVVEGLHHLTERSLPYERIDFVSIEELFTVLYDVVVVIVVVTIVVQLPLLLVRAVLALRLGRPPLLLRVINLSSKMYLAGLKYTHIKN